MGLKWVKNELCNGKWLKIGPKMSKIDFKVKENFENGQNIVAKDLKLL